MKEDKNVGTSLLCSLEDLSEELVLAELSDQESRVGLRGKVSDVISNATDETPSVVSDALSALITLIDGLGEDKAPDIESSASILNETVGALQQIVRDGRSPEEVQFPEGLLKGGSAPRGESALPPGVDDAILSEFLTRQSGVLESMETRILALESAENEGALGELRGLLHTMKGESGMLGMHDVERACHATEDALRETDPGKLTDALLLVKDWLGKTFDAHLGKGDAAGSLDEVLAALSSTDAEAASQQPEPEPTVAAFEDDPELMGEFIGEAVEHLDASEVHLLTLETDSTDKPALDAIFRAFHTIKGLAGFLGLDDIRRLAHEAENVLDKARNGEVALEGGAIDVIFDSIDKLKKYIEILTDAMSSGTKVFTDPTLSKLIDRLKATSTGNAPPAKMPEPAPDKKLGEVLVDSGAATPEDIEAALASQEAPAEQKVLGEMLILSGASSSHDVDEALEIQKHSSQPGKLGEIMVDTGMVTPEEVDRAIDKQEAPAEKPKIGETLVREGKVAARDVSQALRSQKASGAGPAAASGLVQVRETIKVDAGRLDRMVDMIGELVIAESMASQLVEANGAQSDRLSSVMSQLDKITRELQETGMSLRMIPVRSTFQKMARLARDVSKKTNKKVEFRLSGEDTELDKTVVDKISDPLVHMVRNAVDHGIESPEDRRRAGKPEAGVVTLRAYHKASNVYIEIEDDGAGLNAEVILAKARERGLVNDDEQLSDHEIYNLIFEPGFSTAAKVTDVSGRGVGLDVVKRGVETLHGTCEIHSELGKGSVFAIRLPLTLAIIDGMLVRVGAERFIIPTLSITRLIRPHQGDIYTAFQQGEMLKLGDELIPLFHLNRLFGIEGAEDDPHEAVIVVIENEGRQVALVTDETLGQQQIVIKSLGEVFRGIRGVSGGAILPDGRVGLILDIGGVVALANDGAKPQTKSLEAAHA